MKNWYMNTTPLVIFMIFIIAGIYDFACVVFGGTGSTISAFMVKMGLSAPFPVFVIGLICGHFFFAMKPEKQEQKDEPIDLSKGTK